MVTDFCYNTYIYLLTFPVSRSTKLKNKNWCWDLPDVIISARSVIVKNSIVRNLAVTVVWSGCDSKSSTQSSINVMLRYCHTRWSETWLFCFGKHILKFPNEMPRSFLMLSHERIPINETNIPNFTKILMSPSLFHF